MANACAACNGMGYGSVDPEFGYRKGRGEPCATCNAKFQERTEKTGEFGPKPRPLRAQPNRTAVYVDDPNKVVNLDEQGQTAEEVFPIEQVEAQEEADLARMAAEEEGA